MAGEEKGVVGEGGNLWRPVAVISRLLSIPQNNSAAMESGFNQRLSFPGTISPNENLIFFYRTLLH